MISPSRKVTIRSDHAATSVAWVTITTVIP